MEGVGFGKWSVRVCEGVRIVRVCEGLEGLESGCEGLWGLEGC